MSCTGGIPDRVKFLAFRRGEPDADGYFELSAAPVEVNLYDLDRNPLWFEHPEFGRRVDVAAIDVTECTLDLEIQCANELEDDAVLDPMVSQDLFVVGFPFGLALTGVPTPLWKRATIALDPTFDPEGLPKMLIDTATREGMSGSVVLARHIVVGTAVTRKNGTQSEPVLYGVRNVVVGVYSGRHYPDLEKAQLGIVWKRPVIESIVSRGAVPSGVAP